jgi:hypothetical protein
MAIDVAADAELSGIQKQAFLDAANFALPPHRDLDQSPQQGGDGNCGRPESDPEDWFPLISTEIDVADPDGTFRLRERAIAQRLCGGCPLRRPCLAWALTKSSEPCGIWGGLGARDLADLMPAWRTLQVQLAAAVEKEATGRPARQQASPAPAGDAR